MRRLRAAAAVALAPMLVAGLAACNGGGGGTPTALNIDIGDPAPDQVKITAPATSAGGTTRIVLKNSGQLPHEAQLIKVSGATSLEDVRQFIVASSSEQGGPIPNFILAGGGVGRVAPGQTGTVTQKLDEGSWFIVDDERPDEPAPSNVTKGGIVALKVTGGGSDASLPDYSVSITAKDYSFGIEGDLKAGRSSVEFENEGAEFHHLVAFPLLPGKTAEDFKTAIQQEGQPTGTPPFDFEKAINTTVIAGGQNLVTDMDFTAGKYVFACFINDRTGGPPHAIAHNMYREVTVA